MEVRRKHVISHQSFYLWKKNYAGLGLNELRELGQVPEESSKQKRLVADLSLDRHILQKIVAKSSEASHSWRAGGVAQQAQDLSQRRAAGQIPADRAGALWISEVDG